MAPKIISKAMLAARLFFHTISLFGTWMGRNWRISRRLKRQQKEAAAAAAAAAALSSAQAQKQLPTAEPAAPADPPPLKNIVIVGASFAGYAAARFIATALPPGAGYRVVVVEPNDRFHFTWVLPRMCVVEGHEHKALIPYGPFLKGTPEGRLRWVSGRVSRVGRTSVTLESDGEEIPYDHLVIATGSGATDGLPSRVGGTDRATGIALLRAMQTRIRAAGRIVVVGGGAAGVELATDAKDMHRDKEVVLVHSRGAVMNRFGPELQAAALKGLEDLGVEVVLNERARVGDDGKLVTLTSGRTIECDLFINCAGQRPNSGLIAELSPGAISPSGHIQVRPNLQIADDALPNVWVCGDVADTGVRNPNARSAMVQAMTVADNINHAIAGEEPGLTYVPHWGEAVIKLTIGLHKSIVSFSDEKTEVLWRSKEKDLALMSYSAWRNMMVKPYDDIPDGLAPYRAET